MTKYTNAEIAGVETRLAEMRANRLEPPAVKNVKDMTADELREFERKHGLRQTGGYR